MYPGTELKRARGVDARVLRRLLPAVALFQLAGNAAATEVDLISQTSITSAIPNDGNQYISSFSSDGRHVVFSSTASTLLSADRLASEDVYSYDRQTSTLTLVSRSLSGRGGLYYSSGAQVSADGGLVVFYSAATDLVPGDSNGTEDIFLWTRATGATTRIAHRVVSPTGSRFFRASRRTAATSYSRPPRPICRAPTRWG
jgi:Tol biopolymer transport system component